MTGPSEGVDPDPEIVALLRAVQEALPSLESLLDEVNGEWQYEDGIYRFYHQSWKVYYLQSWTERIVEALRALAPHRPLHEWFQEIVAQGTGRSFETDRHIDWPQATRPILEAFFHARYFLEMAVNGWTTPRD